MVQRKRSSLKALLPLVLLSLAPILSWGQYFERNKVQYGAFDFSVLKTEHFKIYHYPQGAPAVMDAARMLEAAYAHHADIFGYGIKGPQKVILYDSFIDFEQTNVIPGIISQGEGGVTEGLMHRIVLPLTGTDSENAHVLAHELVHAFQFEKLAPGAIASASQPLPLWFIEGQAEYLSLGPDDPLTDMWMRDAVLNKDIPSIDDLSSKQGKYFPYRFGDAVWYWIDRGWGKTGIRAFFNDASEKGIPEAINSALGVKTMGDFSARWKGDFAIIYTPKIAGRTLPKDVGRTLPGLDSGFNLSPVISPDGKYIAVFSQRNLFGLDLYLADAETGKVLKNLAGSDSDARYDVLNFIDSAGTWSPDSRSFAFIVERGGQDAVAFVEVPSGKLVKVIPLTSVKGAAGLAWSPDGKAIALSATQDARRDLYLLNPDTRALEPVTSGWHSKLQPTWSPDGKTLAFATDEGAHTDLASLTFQSMNIGLLNMDTKETRIISVKDGAKHINPLFSPDGKNLYFVADTDGYSDLYRYSFDTQQFFRVTNLATGISGLTVLSPCLSMAGTTGNLVMTVFNKKKYEVHVLSFEQAQGSPVNLEGAINSPAVPPRHRIRKCRPRADPPEYLDLSLLSRFLPPGNQPGRCWPWHKPVRNERGRGSRLCLCRRAGKPRARYRRPGLRHTGLHWGPGGLHQPLQPHQLGRGYCPHPAALLFHAGSHHFACGHRHGDRAASHLPGGGGSLCPVSRQHQPPVGGGHRVYPVLVGGDRPHLLLPERPPGCHGADIGSHPRSS